MVNKNIAPLKYPKQITRNVILDLIRRVLEDILPNGKVEEADEVYAADLIGHYQDGLFNLDDVKDRIRAVKDCAKDCSFILQEAMFLSDEIINFSSRQSWRNKLDNSFHSMLVFGTYRVQNLKICEIWMILDTEEGAKSYREINKDFSQNMRIFEHHQKSKKNFLDKLIITKDQKLSSVEKEALYYYFNGFSAKETAIEMRISPRTVETHIAEVKGRLGCRTKHELRRKLFPKPNP